MQRTQHSFYKERKRTQKNARTLRSFEKKAKERKNVAFFWKERLPNPACILFPENSCPVRVYDFR